LALARVFVLSIAALVVLALAAAPAAAAVRIDSVHYDSPGSDNGSNASLNAEYVVIRNTGTRAIQLSNWTLLDRAHHVYHFPFYMLRPGRSVKVHTGTGNDHLGHIYQDADSYIWDNDGDTAMLRRPSGSQADRCSWGNGSGTTSC
jgi:P pilus assembly chaperone PapD